MQIIHVQTNIQAILGLLDDEGNVIKKQPFSVEVSKLNSEAFTEAVNQLLVSKKELEDKLKSTTELKV